MSSLPVPSHPMSKKRRYNVKSGAGREWLQYDDAEGVMFCSVWRQYDLNEHRNQFVRGCSTMKVESVRKHELSQQHKAAEAAHSTHMHPERAAKEFTVQHEELKQVRGLFNAAYYLAEAEWPSRCFPGLL